MPKDSKLRAMSKTDLEDEVMLLRAQVKVLQNWLSATSPVRERYLFEADLRKLNA